jgi:hypothetical protein
MEVLVLREYAWRLWSGGEVVRSWTPAWPHRRKMYSEFSGLGYMIVLQREHVWALQILERNQKWASGYVGDIHTFFPGSAHLGYREGKQTKDSLHGKMPYIKLQKKAGPHRDSCGMKFPGEKSLYFDPTIFDLFYRYFILNFAN